MIPDNKNLPNKEAIWSLANTNDFQAILDLLSKAGVLENDLGEVIFDFGNQAFTNNKFNTAITIFIFLTQALEDKSEAFPLFKKIGDVYTFISEHKKAREYYGKLPLTLENIKLCFKTYIPAVEIDELLALRDTVLSKIPVTNHDQIHTIIDDIMMKIAATPEIFNSHFNYYKKNIPCVKAIPPFTIDSKQLEYDWSSQTAKSWKPEILKISNTIYIKQNKIWQRVFSNNQKNILNKTKLGRDSNIMICCNSPASLFDFINLAQTDNPAFIKYECRVIVDFNLLKLTMNVFDFSPLSNCDFVIKFIDKNNLKSQLIHILLERKHPFTNRVVYLLQDDSTFFPKHVIPTLKECEKKIQYKIEQYEQQLPKIFPDNYQNRVIQKIKTGQKLNILFFTSRFTTYMQYSTRDIAEGFSQLGHKIFIEIEEEDSGVSIRKDVCLENLINFQPDIIFSINHLRYSYPWVPESIPFVSWIQDLMPHIRGLNDSELVSVEDHIFSFSKQWINIFFKNHAVLKKKKSHLLPIPINEKIFYPLNIVNKKYDVIFITHLSDNLDNRTLSQFRQGTPPSEKSYNSKEFKFISHLAFEIYQMPLRKLWKIFLCDKTKKELAIKICRHLSIDFSDDLLNHLKLIDKNCETRFTRDIITLMKIKPIEYLIKNGVDIKVFGENWEKLKGFETVAMGPIENGPPLNRVLNQSKIVLNISPGNSWHMRAADAIASRSFTLTFLADNDGMPMSDLFEKGKDMAVFKDESDLLSKINYYLNNPTERKTIAQNAYNKACSHYSCKTHASKIIHEIMNSQTVEKEV